MNAVAERAPAPPEWLVTVREQLTPLLDHLPADLRGLLLPEVWGLIALVAVLLALVLLGYSLRWLYRKLFAWPARHDWDAGRRENLAEYPSAIGPPHLMVYGLRAWVRLVVVAPVSKRLRLDSTQVSELLERLVPGMGAVVRSRLVRVVVWPAQLAELGFCNSFHRCTPTGFPEGSDSPWLLLAGRASCGRVPIFLGLALQTERPTSLGRRQVTVHQWLEILRPLRGASL
jgi:hypothetical protein